VARTLLAWSRQGVKIGARIRHVDVNGQPGGLMLDGAGRVISVMALDIADGQVRGVNSIVNPDKLAHIGPVADVRELMKRTQAASA
jgi:RNA polymerase sigma-70 factor (ECF subfamily)